MNPSSLCTVCVLLYGDYPELAERCLQSLSRGGVPAGSVRVFANACSERTLASLNLSVIECSGSNIYKYPAMRRMFYSEILPITTPYVMWFDDDSCLRPSVTSQWFADTMRAVVLSDADLAGALYQRAWQGRQREWVQEQPWYRGRELPEQQVPFVQGAWWVAKLDSLWEIDYPWPTLQHNGGDMLLGVAAKQHDWLVLPYSVGVAINADEHLTESAAPRRSKLCSLAGSGLPEPKND